MKNIKNFQEALPMKKVASLIAVLVVVCFSTMIFAADAPKADAAKAAPAATDTVVKKAEPAKADAVAKPAEKKVEKKKAKKAKKVKKATMKKEEKKDAAAPATTEEKKQ
jgi:hypothetical protein